MVLVRQAVINKILTVTQAKIIGETDFYAGIDIKKLRVKSLIKGAENLPLSPELLLVENRVHQNNLVCFVQVGRSGFFHRNLGGKLMLFFALYMKKRGHNILCVGDYERYPKQIEKLEGSLLFSRYANFDISRKIDRNIYVLDNEKDIDSSENSEFDAKRFPLDESMDYTRDIY